MVLLLALQLAASVPLPVSPKDSAKLVQHVRDAEFSYLMDWRHEWEMWQVDLAFTRQSLIREANQVPLPDRALRSIGMPCSGLEAIRFDIDQHESMAHLVRAPQRSSTMSLCPNWVPPTDTEPADEALGIDNPLTREYQDTVRSRRAPLIALLDSTAHMIPGDGWVAGQRVRMYVDQKQLIAALRAANECRAAAWWCGMLRGYVHSTGHDAYGAGLAFDSALTKMPADTACRWNDVSALLIYSARAAYQQMSCLQQVPVNARIWWLANPLYLVPGNERRTENFARRVLAALLAGNDVDEREDMRDQYSGPAEQEMILRYGWPTTMVWTPPRKCAPQPPRAPGMPRIRVPQPCYYVVPPGWGRFDTKSTYLGVVGLNDSALRPRPEYWGPQYHTLPSWTAIVDPLHAQPTDWQLGPEREEGLYWDSSWWAPEFYQRYEGPLVDLSTQIAFIRRSQTAAIAAAPEWQRDVTHLAPPEHAIVGVITSGGPDERRHVIGVKMNGATPRAVLTPVESRPLLLGVEMAPENDSGPAARTRFGIDPPPPLNALRKGTIAISDPILVRAGPQELGPASIQLTLPRMYGSTQLVNPHRLAVFWEVYGQADRDTVDVSFRVVRHENGGALAHAGAVVGIGSTSPDSISVNWREPRPGDPLATVDSGVSIRPRSIVLDISAQPAGNYALEVSITRHGVKAVSSVREFSIRRP